MLAAAVLNVAPAGMVDDHSRIKSGGIREPGDSRHPAWLEAEARQYSNLQPVDP